MAQLVKNLPKMRETWVRSLGWEDPLEKEKATTPVFWPEEFHGLCSPWSCKKSGTTERLGLSASFHVPIGHLFVFSGDMSIKISPFFSSVVCFFVLELYELLYILSVTSFANIFSYSKNVEHFTVLHVILGPGLC